MSLKALLTADQSTFDLVSVDLFDTLMLRDHSIQLGRFNEVARCVSKKLTLAGYTVETKLLRDLRRRVHEAAYQAVAFERPAGDVTFDAMVAIQLTQLGLPQTLGRLFNEAEREVEARHLLPNKQLASVLTTLRRSGKRVVAISDMYIGKNDLLPLLHQVMVHSPVEEIYVSCDLGVTKQSGQLFARVATLEQVPLARILHCGDNEHSDVVMPHAAGCQAVLLRRPGWMHLRRGISALQGLVAGLA